MHKPKINLTRELGYGSIGLLGLLLLALLLPFTPDDVSAETLTVSLSTKTTAYLYSTISLSTSGQVDIDIKPKSTGSLEIGTAEVKVATNNTTGYSIFLSTVDGSNKLNQIDNKLQYTGEQEKYAIDSLSSATTAENYLSNQANLNTWGYALTTGTPDNNTEYKGLTSTTGDNIYTTSSTSSNDSYQLNLAVAVDTTIPAGGYRNGLVVTAVANPVQVSGFNKIMYMQEMTPAVCNEVEVGDTGELVDKRDNTIYQVAKLADEHCWMTQNLALDLSTEVALMPEDSDVTESWVPKTSTEHDIPLPNTANIADTRSWDLGKIILMNPTESSRCPRQDPATSGVTGQSYPNSDNGNSAFTGQSIANTCPEYYKDVSNGWFADANSELYSATSSTNGNNYNPHYLIGNYYQWNTATAGSAISVTGTDATNTGGVGLTNASDSICPKGWKLPKAGRNISPTETRFGVGPGQSFDINGSFYGLLNKYGYNTGWAGSGDNGYISITAGAKRLDYEPMYFVRGGVIVPGDGSLRDAGLTGYAWSSTAYPSSNFASFLINFMNTTVYPSNSSIRTFGYSVRCLAR